jgi:hypothetical protein
MIKSQTALGVYHSARALPKFCSENSAVAAEALPWYVERLFHQRQSQRQLVRVVVVLHAVPQFFFDRSLLSSRFHFFSISRGSRYCLGLASSGRWLNL